MEDNRLELVLDWCKSNRGRALTSQRKKFLEGIKRFRKKIQNLREVE